MTPSGVSNSDPFGHWLAGFLDGEGTFVISRHARGAYRCAVRIKLRQDDEPILVEIAEFTSCGRIFTYVEREPDKRREATATWVVDRRDQCAAMVRLLDRYPLRAKKARDYAIWREAVQAWASARPGPRGSLATWVRMAALARQLKAVRAFDAEPAADEPDEPDQLRLVEEQ